MALDNALSVPFRIPPELLCEIFKLLCFCDRVQATHVCKYWRTASLEHSRALWSIIHSNGMKSGALGDQLARTRGVPVDVAVLLKGTTMDEAMSAISAHLHHIRSLVLFTYDLGQGEVEMENIHQVYKYIARPAPMLEELDIALAIPDYHPDDFRTNDRWERWMRSRILAFDYTMPPDLFAGHAPRLRQAAWLVMELNPQGCAALSGLTRFAFEARRLLASQLHIIVNCLPQLKCLLIEIHDFEGLPDSPRPETFVLDELYLSIPERGFLRDEEQDILPVLEYLGYTRIPRVVTYRFDKWLDCFTAPPRSLPHTLHLDALGFMSTSFWHMVDDRGFVSQGLRVPAHEMLDTPLGRHLFANLETLVIETSVLLSHREFPPLPRLSHLCMRIRERLSGVPPLKTPSEPVLDCPSVETLEIWWDSDQPTCDPGEISRDLDFCLKSVSYNPDPPLHVILRGATPPSDELPHPSYTVTVSNEPVPESFVAERGIRWHVHAAAD
ncbi:hypothetical protein AURDEDRAFT_174493 [Auricularia subglabra TFB-10046 SS5]|uniref:F-box domain-containing protein n=1 Tax=Auricularia subglabra (strain TFB-10046 / SS5) TaxID=717982 RepID=J0WT27_AURST|nr:hypothetical protein AURDEDRAFT_174493 [Auricularia subglabra TFB-10046 SS5]